MNQLPLSLIAIDTLRAIVHLPTPMLKKREVRLHDAPAFSVLEETLREYEKRDNVPRVSQRINALLNNPAMTLPRIFRRNEAIAKKCNKAAP